MQKWPFVVLIQLTALLTSSGTAHADTSLNTASDKQRILFSTADAIRQNTAGLSEGFPAGVPSSYSWYQGRNPDGQHAPESGFTAVTGWGQVYQNAGSPPVINTGASVELANARTFVHLRSTGEWVLVQDQSTNQIAGGHFVPDFAGNAGYEMSVKAIGNGVTSFAAPPLGFNNHFWPSARGTFADGDVDAVYVQMDMRITDRDLNLVANVGADWWRGATAAYVDGHGNNPGAGMSNWIVLSTEWKRLAFYSSSDVFRASPPPPFVEAGERPPERRRRSSLP